MRVPLRKNALPKTPPGPRRKSVSISPQPVYEQLLEQLKLQNEELRQAQLQLEESRDRYADLYDFSPVGYVTFDARGLVREMNLTGASMLGIDRNGAIGLPLVNFIAGADRPKFYTHLRECKHATKQIFVELGITTPRGHFWQAQLSSLRLRGIGERETLWLSTFTDITTLKHAEQILREMYAEVDLRVQQRTAELEQAHKLLRDSEIKFRSLVEQSTDGIAIFDQAGHILEWNRAQEKIFGLQHAQVVGKPYWEIWAELAPVETRNSDAFEQVNAMLQAILQTGELNHELFGLNDYGLYNSDGTLHDIQTSMFAIKTERGNLVGAISRDVTERKQAEAQLHESEKKYRDLINGMNETVWVIDFDTTILDVNNAATRVLGYSREELLAMKIADIDVTLKPEQIQNLASNMPKDKAQVFETCHTAKDGRRIPVEVSSSLVSYLGRAVIMSIARDITKRKQVEAKLLFVSTHDTLTGLYNRAFFSEELQRLTHSRHFPVSIVVTDVNGLKQVNDSEGHAAGDALLQNMAHFLTEAFRSEDLVARLGGDEFAVILMDTGAQQAKELLARVQSHLLMHNARSGFPPLSFAIGIATAEKGKDLETTLKCADREMYHDKAIHHTIPR